MNGYIRQLLHAIYMLHTKAFAGASREGSNGEGTFLGELLYDPSDVLFVRRDSESAKQSLGGGWNLLCNV